MTYQPDAASLRHHGDIDARPGLVDLAVNVRAGTPPAWLRDVLASVDLAAYPDATRACEALARRHRRSPADVLPTAGAAEAFVLIARAFRPKHAVVVHPQFTEPEVALRAAGQDVHRVILDRPFRLDPGAVPDSADLVVIGNPTNPTSVLHHGTILRSLARPGRILVVDEAFADAVPGEPESLAAQGDVPGLVVVRSLTKTWGLAGARAGYVLAAPDLVAMLANAQPRWSVSTLALAACVACSTETALTEADAWARHLTTQRDYLAEQLHAVPGVHVAESAAASFVLVHADRPRIWNPLRDKGYAVRRGDSFPGLGPHWIRVAVRDEQTSTAFAIAVKECV